MARTRYGARRRPVEERTDPLDTFGGLLADFAKEMSPVVNIYRAGLFEDEYPIAPFATPRDRMLSLLEEPEYQRYIDNVASSGMGATTKATKAAKPVKRKKLGGKFQDVPVFDPNQYIGKKVAPIEADLTAGSRYFSGIDSSKVADEPLLGGPEYVVQEGRIAEFDALPAETKRRIAEARTGSGLFSEYPQKPVESIWASKVNDLVKAEGKKADLITVHAMKPDSHQSNQSIMNATLKQLASYVKDKRLSDDQITKLDDLIKANVPEFPGLRSPDVFDVTDQMSFDKRAKILKTLQQAKATDAGSPASKIVRDTLSSEFAGTQRHQPLLALKPYRDAAGKMIPLEMGRDIPGTHPSYTKAFAGEVVGRFAAPNKPESLYPEYYARRRGEGMAEKDINFSFASRDFPLQEITPQVAAQMRSAPYEYIQSPRQVRLATDAGLGNWRVMSGRQTKGSTDFNRELSLSPASATLTKYDNSDLTKMIKRGEMTLYALGDDGKIGFGIKRGTNYNKEYPVSNPIFSDDDTAIVSVFNNEKGARGVAGPGTMLEALRQGGNVLDAFAVPTEKNPRGFLPDTYEKFGFEVVERVPFSSEFYTKQQIADLVDYWESTGWDKSTGFPDIVIMKYTGAPDVRQNPIRTFFEQGEISPARAIGGFDTSAAESFIVESGKPSTRIRTRSNNRQNDRGAMGRSDAPAPVGRFSGLLSEISALSPQDAFNLNLPPSDVSSLRSLLFGP